ncbi:MAG: SIMPL domain-containing protein [Hymenobacter sp.]|nr:MAG: SIMPL domain-containing protein [Hymenobacter sp.]
MLIVNKLHLFPLLLVVQTAFAQVPTPAMPHTILVRGTAERELDPEKLDLLLTYRFSDNVKENERTQNQEENLRQVLAKASITPDKLVLEELSATGYGGLSKVGNANVALTKVYRLTLDNPQQLNTLIPQLVQTGADNLRFVNLQNSRLVATKAELATQAATDARQKATLAVKAAGSQLGSVVTMVEVLPEGSYSEVVLREKQSASAMYQAREVRVAETPPPSLRKIKVHVVYDVVFEIKP